MAVNITNLTANVNNIQGLSDRPNITDGITSQQLKELFDKAPSDIKTYINGTLIPELETLLNGVNSEISSIDSSITTIENNYQVKASYGTSDPTGGSDGDIYFKYS